MKLRHKHIPIADSLKTGMRQRVTERDEDDKPTRWEQEVYAPAHVHIIQYADGRLVYIHHENYPKLKKLLTAPRIGIEDLIDPDEGESSDAVYIKLDPRVRENNVTYQRPVSKGALTRFQTATSDETLPVG